MDIFREIQVVHETGYFSSRITPEESWQQVHLTDIVQHYCIYSRYLNFFFQNFQKFHKNPNFPKNLNFPKNPKNSKKSKKIKKKSNLKKTQLLSKKRRKQQTKNGLICSSAAFATSTAY
jgi:hypothetical protein